MSTYLLFDSTCPLCARVATEICNANTSWIDRALSLHTEEAKKLLAKSNRPDLKEPALLDVTESKTRIVTGIALRWIVFRHLGFSKTARLIRVIDGNLAARRNPPTELPDLDDPCWPRVAPHFSRSRY